MKPKAFVSAEMDYAIAKELEELLDIDYDWGNAVLTEAQMVQRCAGKDVIITSYDPVTKAVIDAAEGCGLIVCTRATPVNVDTAYARSKGIKVSYAVDRNSDCTAEFTMGLILAVTRKIGFAYRDLCAGRFVAEDIGSHGSESAKRDVTWSTGEESPYVTYKGFQLKGHTVGIVGLGGIGRRVAKLCHAFGMEVYATPSRRDPEEIPAYVHVAPLEEFAPLVDVLTIHLKDTPATQKLINADVFKAMKKTAYLINDSRGAVVDEDALVEALREGEIAGAAIDVFPTEPIAADHPFFEMSDRVLITPHIAGATWDAISNHTREFVADVKHYLKGEELEFEYKK
jgi:D-3-phosphoglycerate dehydrogenase